MPVALQEDCNKLIMNDQHAERPWWWCPRLTDGVDRGHVIDCFHEPYEFKVRLLEALRAAVPEVEDIDGLDRTTRFALPKELDEPHLKGAAMELMLGELEAAVECGPDGENEDAYLRGDSESWEEQSDKVASELRAIVGEGRAEPEPNSIEDHASAALHWLQQIRVWSSVHEDQAANPDEAVWVRTILAEQAVRAFEAGRRFQKVVGKPWEPHAVRGKKVQEGAAEGGAGRKGKLSPDTIAALDYMEAWVRAREAEGQSTKVTEAAAAAKRAGHGKSIGANRKAWNRYMTNGDDPAK